jgi:hypothetical protein
MIETTPVNNEILEKDFGYEYPNGLDLRPKSALHRKLVNALRDRATRSRRVMEERFPSWEKIDQNLTCYIELDEEEKDVQASDKRKPVSIVVPLTFMTLDTLTTYYVERFLNEPYFHFEGCGPEDVLGAKLMEKVIEHQCRSGKAGLAIYVQMMDALKRGFGVITRPVGQAARKANREERGRVYQFSSSPIHRDRGF